MKRLKAWIPQWVKTGVRRLKYYVLYRGKARFCPVCEKYSSQFLPMVWANDESPRRENVKCPFCYSFERHRLVYLFLQRRTDLLSEPRGRVMIHIAPEPCLRDHFRRTLGASYRTADLADPNADMKLDICNIEFPDDSFDIIVCSHVLEHIPDDHKAMCELRRTLKPDGCAIIMVPIGGEKTLEDWTITDKNERNRRFGMDHVRLYGTDIEERLRAGGLNATCTRARDFLRPQEIELMGILAEEQVYFCTKA